MLGSILSTIGGNLGKFFGSGILSTIGRYAGRRLGNLLEKKWTHTKRTEYKATNIKESFHIVKARYGTAIPLIFGKMRVNGQIIWIDKIYNKENTIINSKYFASVNQTIQTEKQNFEYYASFAMALCVGEILEINRVWNEDQIIDISSYNFRLYKGGEEQFPDPLIEAKSDNQAAAYRGLAYIVFESLPLIEFNNLIPNLSFEVVRKPNVKEEIKNDIDVEELVNSMVIIPGTGEYVYDTIIQTKTLIDAYDIEIYTEKINSHNYHNIANSLYSLNQLKNVCSNVEWIAPVICWFGNNIDARHCLIKPGVEYKQENIKYSEEWLIGKYDRHNAFEVSKDEKNNPVYGGSVNDASVIRFLHAAKERNLKIMFYPMFFLDIHQKPWRGRVSCDIEYVADFFQREHGYNDFIIHYANLVKDYVDAFVIGSELIGLTKIGNENYFPAVEQLVNLARIVKEIVGANVLVTYAADWSEYHHTQGGWYNLDPLWASENIDFIGIDAYFPSTSSMSSAINIDDIKQGFCSGEGYEYYIDPENEEKKPLEPKYAWKNLRYWWENIHINPDGYQTLWQPKSKPIWFTEFGFPSVDKASNQPNVFFDPKSIDGGVPKYSNGNIDFSIQRKAIKAFLQFWQQEEYIEKMFLWTWDARPYPAWPHMDIWRDSCLWEKGHWVNNKFGICNIGKIIKEISQKCEVDNIDISSIDQIVEGIIFNESTMAIDVIDTLRTVYFFDIFTKNNGKLVFLKRAYKNQITINEGDFIKLSDDSYIKEIDIGDDLILGKIDFYYINEFKSYRKSYCHYNNKIGYNSKKTIKLNIPIVLIEHEVKAISELILTNARIENKILHFSLSIQNYNIIYPTDLVTIKYENKQYYVRIIEILLKDNQYYITAIIDQQDYYFNISNNKITQNLKYSPNLNSEFLILDLIDPNNVNYNYYLTVFLNYNQDLDLFYKFENMDNYNFLQRIIPSNNIAKLINLNLSRTANIFIIDQISEIIIRIDNIGQINFDEWNLAIFGQEYIYFRNIIEIEKNTYSITEMIRGVFASENYINNHSLAEHFIIINHVHNIIPTKQMLINKEINFLCNKQQQTLKYQGVTTQSLKPYITKNEIINDQLHIEWLPRDKLDFWNNYIENKTYQFTIKIEFNNQIYQEITNEYKIIKNIFNLGLSADYKIDIITNILN